MADRALSIFGSLGLVVCALKTWLIVWPVDGVTAVTATAALLFCAYVVFRSAVLPESGAPGSKEQ